MDILNVILNIILWIIILQLSTISHELGHAIPALVFSKDKVKVLLGYGDSNMKTICLGRLEFELKKFSPFTGFVGWNGAKMNRMQKIIAVAGGPVTSILIGIGFISISITMRRGLVSQVLILSACAHFLQFLVTAIPIKYPKFWGAYKGCYSDGYKVFALIKGN